MHRWFRFCAALALIAAGQTPLRAQESAPGEGEAAAALPTPGKHQLRPTPLQVMQHFGEQQAKANAIQSEQLERLNREVGEQGKKIASLEAKLEAASNRLDALGGQLGQAVALLETLAHATPAPKAAVVPAPSAAPEPSHAVPAPAPEAKPAFAGVENTVHVVKRGENLTSIARQHGTTVAELLKLNKIEDERKLQIGQSLAVPPPAAASPDPAP